MISIASNGGSPGSSPKKKTRTSVPTPPHRPRPMPPERTPSAMKPTTISPSIAIRNQSVVLVVVDAGSGAGGRRAPASRDVAGGRRGRRRRRRCRAVRAEHDTATKPATPRSAHASAIVRRRLMAPPPSARGSCGCRRARRRAPDRARRRGLNAARPCERGTARAPSPAGRGSRTPRAGERGFCFSCAFATRRFRSVCSSPVREAPPPPAAPRFASGLPARFRPSWRVSVVARIARSTASRTEIVSSTESPEPPSFRRAAKLLFAHLVADRLELALPCAVVPHTSSAQLDGADGLAGVVAPVARPPPRCRTRGSRRRRTLRSRRARASGTAPGFESSSTHADEQPPEALASRDAHPLVGRVRRLDLRAERDHVEARATLSPMTAVSSPA